MDAADSEEEEEEEEDASDTEVENDAMPPALTADAPSDEEWQPAPKKAKRRGDSKARGMVFDAE